MEEKQLNMPDEHPVPKKKKRKGRTHSASAYSYPCRRRSHWLLFLRTQPASQRIDKYLTGIQSLDFDTMESMLQSADLSALDNADVRNATYESFFKSINAKMTWKITKTRFSFQDGTAEVTARIRYVDGSDIYRETVTEFLRQIVSSAFSGESLTEQETQDKLAAILIEKPPAWKTNSVKQTLFIL